MTGAQIERARAKERGSKLINQTLSDDEFDEFTEILQTLTISRNDIKYAMGFAYDKVEAAEDIVNILKESLILRTTSPPLKIARLYLLSDILYNSGVPIKYASNYR
jgi:U2-associated protein SR140